MPAYRFMNLAGETLEGKAVDAERIHRANTKA
jgi:hypothetical protein